MILQQDNDCPHIANVVPAKLQRAQTDTLPWPANSPDMAPIEHAWDELQYIVDHLPRAPTTLQEFELVLVQEWQNILQAFFTRDVGSVRRRCQACIDANSGHTRY